MNFIEINYYWLYEFFSTNIPVTVTDLLKNVTHYVYGYWLMQDKIILYTIHVYC